VRQFWEERYSEQGLAYGDTPNRFLHSQLHVLPRGGKVLVLGDGEGRNGVWLAQQGMTVTSVDYAEAGVARAKLLAKQRGVKINAICADLADWDWPQDEFDAVVSIYLHFPSELRKSMHERMLAALKPKGVLLMEAFNKAQLNYSSGGPPVEDALFSADELREDFSQANIRLLEESIVELSEGKYHRGEAAVVRLILQ
jgi:cyclopropane fatty-acyl-phospholipid synthase-like methyltransferase